MDLNKILSSDDVEFLRDLARELKTQDTLCTAKPIFWQVREKVKRYAIDPNYSDSVCVLIGDDGGEHFEDVDEAKKHLVEDYEIPEEDLSWIDELAEIEEFCNKRDILCHYTGYDNDENKSGCFLTKKALDNHIKLNYYHYKQGKNTTGYCDHAWRNPELKRLLEIVEKFDSVEGSKA